MENIATIITCSAALQHRAVTACLLAFLVSNMCIVAGCDGSAASSSNSSSSFKCFPSSTQPWNPPSASSYEQTEDLGGQDLGNVHTDDPQKIDRATASGCAGELLAKLPSGIATVQVALDNMYVNDEAVIAEEFAKQLPDPLLQSLVQTRPGRLLVFHVFLDATGQDSLIGPEPQGPGGDIAMASKLEKMLLASFPEFQRLLNQPWLGDPTVQAVVSQSGISFQTLEQGNGPYRFDNFTIIIQQMPPGLTPQAFLGEMAQDMNKTANNQQFNDLSSFKWRDTSHPPMVGDINDIDFGSAWGLPTRGSPSPVMLVEKTDTHFVFQTVQGHILHGAREFGFYTLPQGRMLLYTRAISRDSSLLSKAGGAAGHANELQAKTWAEFMVGMCGEMQRRGGSCDPTNPNAGEQPWTRRLELSAVSSGAKALTPSSASATELPKSPPTLSEDQKAELATVSTWMGLLSATQNKDVDDYPQPLSTTLAIHIISGVSINGRPMSPADVVSGLVPPDASMLVSFTFHGGLGSLEGKAHGSGEAEVRGITVQAHPDKLGQADQANGVTFQGRVDITFISRYRTNTAGPFTDWRDDGEAYYTTLRNGVPTVGSILVWDGVYGTAVPSHNTSSGIGPIFPIGAIAFALRDDLPYSGLHR